MSIYYKYALDGTKTVVLYYVDYYLYCYTYEAIGKWFVDALGKRFHVKFLVYANWFISIKNYQMKNHSIYVDQARYETSSVAKYLYTATVKTSTKFYKNTLPSDMIFTKYDVYTNDDQVEKFIRGLKIHYRACIESLIYFPSTRVYLIFQYTS